MKKISVNKINDDESQFYEMVITENEELCKYLIDCNIGNVKIPSGIKTINSGIFDVRFPKIIKKIEPKDGYNIMEAFYQIRINKLFIPKTVETIKEEAFKFAEIHEFIIEKPNEDIHLVNGLLLNDKKDILLACSGSYDSNQPWPNTVKRIGKNAFSSVDFMSCVELDIPEGVKEIGSEAFGGAYGIIDIYLPRSIELIEERGLQYDEGEYPYIYVYENSYAHKYVVEHKIKHRFRLD